ncbi:hypothetical protein D3C87_547030 [compost metagenome]
MKNFLKIASFAIIALSANSIFAQTTTTLNVNLASVYSIEVTNPTVNILMNTPANFTQGNTSGPLPNHIKVSATGGYKVSIQASNDLTSTANDVIPVSTVVVSTTPGTFSGAAGSIDTGSNAAFPANAPALSATAPVELITSTTGDIRGFNVQYTIPASSAPVYLNKPAAIYSTLLTYTIVAN